MVQLIRKSSGNYFFGNVQNEKQELVATFNTPAELVAWFVENKQRVAYRKVIKAEYSQSHTVWHIAELTDLAKMTKRFSTL